MNRRGPMLVVKILVMVAIAVAGFGSAVLYLWNWLMPALFGLPLITFWQALGLMGLSWILFGGLRGFGGPHHHCGGRPWRAMSPEERERFHAGFRGRWCRHDEPEESGGAAPYKDFA